MKKEAFMADVIEQGSVIEFTDINDTTLIGRVISFKMYRNDNKYSPFIFVEEIEDVNTDSEHYGQACVAVDDIKSIKVY